MSKQYSRIILFAIVIIFIIAGYIFLFSIVKGFTIEAENREKIVSESFIVFSFNSDSVLTSLSNGEKTAFTKIGDNEDLYLEYSGYLELMHPVQWKQDDFMIVADEFVSQFTGAPLTNWQMHNLLFRLSCEDASLGPQRMDIQLFTAGSLQGEKNELNISIYPQNGYLNGWSLLYSPYLSGEGLISLNEIKIPAEKALEIAELIGGNRARYMVSNDCEIRIGLTASRSNSTWKILYYSQNSGVIFSVFIDINTGKYEVVLAP